jgi:hypothetical protein
MKVTKKYIKQKAKQRNKKNINHEIIYEEIRINDKG